MSSNEPPDSNLRETRMKYNSLYEKGWDQIPENKPKFFTNNKGSKISHNIFMVA